MLAGATLAYWVLLERTEGSLALGELPLAVGLGIAAVLGGRWLLVAGELAGIVRQRRRLDKELEAGGGGRAMTTLIVVNIVALWIFLVFQGLVLLEMVRQQAQVRRQLDLDDRPVPISLGEIAGRPLPEPARAAWSENGTVRDGVLVLLSVNCTTCRLVASGLRDVVNGFEDQRIVTVLGASNHDQAVEMLNGVGLAWDEVVVDLENEYGDALGIDLRPVAVVVRGGIVSEGATIRNPRQLRELLERLEAPTRKGEHAPESVHRFDFDLVEVSGDDLRAVRKTQRLGHGKVNASSLAGASGESLARSRDRCRRAVAHWERLSRKVRARLLFSRLPEPVPRLHGPWL